MSTISKAGCTIVPSQAATSASTEDKMDMGTLKALTKRFDDFEMAQEKSAKRTDELEKSNKDLKERISKMEKENEKLQNTVAQALKENWALKRELMAANKENLDYEEKKKKMLKVIDRHENSIKHLKKLLERYEFPQDYAQPPLENRRSRDKNWWKTAFLVLAGGVIGFAIAGPYGAAYVGLELVACTAGGALVGAEVDSLT